jgi:hypothetical protein
MLVRLKVHRCELIAPEIRQYRGALRHLVDLDPAE